VLDGIRADMKTPLARPPGRRGVWVRFAPEICAAGVYGVGLAVMLCLSHRFDQAYVIYFDPSESDLMNGIVTATMREEVVGIIYAPIIVLFVVAEIVLALWAYRSLARNFDAYMTGEKPERA